MKRGRKPGQKNKYKVYKGAFSSGGYGKWDKAKINKELKGEV